MDDFYAARDNTTTPLPWPSIAPPITAIPVVGVETRYRNLFAQWIPADGDSVDSVLTFGLSFALQKQD